MDELTTSKEAIVEELKTIGFSPNTDLLPDGPQTDDQEDAAPEAFWDDQDVEDEAGDPVVDGEDDKPKDSDEDSKPSDKEDVSEDGQSGTIKYKAGGEEVEITLEEAQRRLAMADEKVVRKAFSERAALKKQNQKLKQEAEANAEYRDTWEKLESIKHDRHQLWKAITGEDLNSYIKAERERQELFEAASPEEQRAILAEQKLQERDRIDAEERKRREEQLNKADERIFQAEKKELRGLMLEEAREIKFASDNPQVSNKLNKMLWVNAVHDLEGYYEKYGKITKKMVKKAFTDNASAIKHLYNVDAPAAAAAETTKKKEVAKGKAAAAATKNYNADDTSKLSRLKPDELYRKYFKR